MQKALRPPQLAPLELELEVEELDELEAPELDRDEEVPELVLDVAAVEVLEEALVAPTLDEEVEDVPPVLEDVLELVPLEDATAVAVEPLEEAPDPSVDAVALVAPWELLADAAPPDALDVPKLAEEEPALLVPLDAVPVVPPVAALLTHSPSRHV